MAYHALKHSVNDLDLCDASFIMLYTLWYQLIPHKERVFLPSLVRNTSTASKTTLPVILPV